MICWDGGEWCSDGSLAATNGCLCTLQASRSAPELSAAAYALEQQSAHKCCMHFTFPCFGCRACVRQPFAHFKEPAATGGSGAAGGRSWP